MSSAAGLPGTVYLVGAGPGDPGLITVRGRELLARADAVVYDRLAPAELLDACPPAAERHYVGKAAGRHSLDQAGICRLLADLAARHQVVVRLKGGDPFLFGRGGEEALYLAERGIPFEVVPGVTSALAVPAYAGIPVTHRGVASSLAIATGHGARAEDEPEPGAARPAEPGAHAAAGTFEEAPVDWAAVARGADTLVVLMGVGALERITGDLLAGGKDPATPAAVIERGTTPGQRVVTGRLSDIAARARTEAVKPPALLVVGKVVRLRQAIVWLERRPLFGRRVVVTRAREQQSALRGRLGDLGAQVLEFPVIRIEPPADVGPLAGAVARLAEFHWIVFTSPNGVAGFWDRLAAAGLDARALAGARLGAVGPGTADALAARGVRADLVPGRYETLALAEALRGRVCRGMRVLLPRAAEAPDHLTRALAGLGVEVEEVPAYRTVMDGANAAAVRSALAEGTVDAVTFTSSSTVRNFFAALAPGTPAGGEPARLLGGVATVCIGPVTATTLREYGIEPAAVASPSTIDGLVEAVVRAVGTSGRDQS